MIDSHLKTQLEKATLELDKTADIEGILIVASDGRILHHNLRVDVDMNLFGPMSQVISNSSHRLLNSSGQGEMERVLVESSGGKALFLGLENTHLIILMQDTANVGLILVNAKRASQKIDDATHDLELEVPTEVPVEEMVQTKETLADVTINEEPVSEEVPATEISSEIEGITDEKPIEIQEEIPEETVEKPGEDIEDAERVLVEDSSQLSETETNMEASETIIESVEPVSQPTPELTEELETKPEIELETAELGELKEVKVDKEVPKIAEADAEELEEEKVEEEVKEIKPTIPTVKPPISFPTLPTHVEVPDDLEKRSDLILDIYEKIFLAMSMGAAKIMGVAPARGLTKKFLPFEKCQRLLQNVDLKSNATIDFAQIKKNASEIPLAEREEIFIRDFSRMIEIITENYGRVMGYEAFRGMVRAEFLAINKSYGDAMDKLNIKQNMHPEIAILFS
jgi:predicted regulator of Ras-like GTPase activity (Roadblock/LC7/MglB family)